MMTFNPFVARVETLAMTLRAIPNQRQSVVLEVILELGQWPVRSSRTLSLSSQQSRGFLILVHPVASQDHQKIF